MLGWHFLLEDRRLRFGEREQVEVGEWISVEGELRMCEWGLHASKRAADALRYAPGPVACRVELRGDLQHDEDKSVGRKRKVLWMVDAEDTLRRFARMCALDVVHLWDAPDVVVQYLKTGDESIRAAAWNAAWAAAGGAAGSAAWAAAGGAAWNAAWAAAGGAAWAAAWGAAWAAAWDAARDAAWGAARAAQNRRLTAMLSKLPREEGQ